MRYHRVLGFEDIQLHTHIESLGPVLGDQRWALLKVTGTLSVTIAGKRVIRGSNATSTYMSKVWGAHLRVQRRNLLIVKLVWLRKDDKVDHKQLLGMVLKVRDPLWEALPDHLSMHQSLASRLQGSLWLLTKNLHMFYLILEHLILSLHLRVYPS